MHKRKCQAGGARIFAWQVLDSNQRRLSQRIYSPLPLATRETCRYVVGPMLVNDPVDGLREYRSRTAVIELV
jgi:hypothetical protein